MSGFVALHRIATEHPLFAADVGRFGAWCWMVAKACWRPTRFNVSGKVIMLERGQLCYSVRDLADAWGWSKSAVDRFLTRLKTETMIETQSGTGRLVITICNYERYQDRSDSTGTPSGTPSGTAAGQQRDIKEQGNKRTKVSEEANASSGADAPQPEEPVGRTDLFGSPPGPTAADVQKAIFATGRSILKAAGHDDRHAGSIIGRWRKQYGDPAVLTALSRCQVEQPEVPVEWVTKALQHQENRSSGGSHANRSGGYHRETTRETGERIAARLAAGANR